MTLLHAGGYSYNLFALLDDRSHNTVMSLINAKQTKREKILDQGVQMLMTKGYHGTGLKEILDTVNIPKGSFYHYFSSKEAFAAEAVTHYIAPYIQRLNAHLHNPRLDGLSALTSYYDELILELARSDFRGGCLLGNLMGEIGDTSDLCRQAILSAVEHYSSLQESALLRGQHEGTVRTDQTAKMMADLLLNSWQGALLRMKIELSVQPLRDCRIMLLDDYFTI